MDSTEFNKKYVRWVHKRFFKRPGNLLDLGNGDGTTTEEFKNLGYAAQGFDRPQINLNKKFNFYINSNNDFIFVKSVIEHLANPKDFLKQCNDLLKKGGLIYIHTPNIEKDTNFFIEDPEHISPFDKTTLKNLLEDTGFKVIYLEEFRNIPYLWRFTQMAFNYSYFPMALVCVGEKLK